MLFCCRQDWQAGRGRKALENLVHLPFFRRLMALAGMEGLDPGAWRNFLSAERIEDALPGFICMSDAAARLGVSLSDVGRWAPTVNIGYRVMVIEDGVTQAMLEREFERIFRWPR